MKQIGVRLKDRSYSVVIGRRLLSRVGSFLRRLNVGSKVMIVSNRHVAKRCGFLKPMERSLAASGYQSFYHELPHGNEKDKSEESLSELWKSIVRAGLD